MGVYKYVHKFLDLIEIGGLSDFIKNPIIYHFCITKSFIR